MGNESIFKGGGEASWRLAGDFESGRNRLAYHKERGGDGRFGGTTHLGKKVSYSEGKGSELRSLGPCWGKPKKKGRKKKAHPCAREDQRVQRHGNLRKGGGGVPEKALLDHFSAKKVCDGEGGKRFPLGGVKTFRASQKIQRKGKRGGGEREHFCRERVKKKWLGARLAWGGGGGESWARQKRRL